MIVKVINRSKKQIEKQGYLILRGMDELDWLGIKKLKNEKGIKV